MPAWEVRYTTKTEPTGLPPNAVVTKVSEYPVTVRRGSERLDICKVPDTPGALDADLVASLKLGKEAIHLNRATARQVMRTLVTLVEDRERLLRRRELDLPAWVVTSDPELLRRAARVADGWRS